MEEAKQVIRTQGRERQYELLAHAENASDPREIITNGIVIFVSCFGTMIMILAVFVRPEDPRAYLAALLASLLLAAAAWRVSTFLAKRRIPVIEAKIRAIEDGTYLKGKTDREILQEAEALRTIARSRLKDDASRLAAAMRERGGVSHWKEACEELGITEKRLLEIMEFLGYDVSSLNRTPEKEKREE